MDCPRAGQNGENYGKQHKNVIQSIENIKAENSAVIDMFHEATYSGMAEIGDTPYYFKLAGDDSQEFKNRVTESDLVGKIRSKNFLKIFL